MNIQNLEQLKVNNTMHFIIAMSNKDKKNTLCVFPENMLSKPKSSEKITDGEFYMVNGQHCVEASKQLQRTEDVCWSTC